MLKKMKTRKRLAALITLITLFAFSSVMTGITAAQEASLVSATLTTDKESYDEGENVNIALTVKNGNIYGIDKVKSEIGLPDGLTLKKGELTDGGYTLAAGQSRSNEITAYRESLKARRYYRPCKSRQSRNGRFSVSAVADAEHFIGRYACGPRYKEEARQEDIVTVLMCCNLADSITDRCICRRGHNAECKRKCYGK